MQLREVLVISETVVNYCNKHGKKIFFKKQHVGKDLKNNHYKKIAKFLMFSSCNLEKYGTCDI